MISRTNSYMPLSTYTQTDAISPPSSATKIFMGFDFGFDL